MKTLKYDEEKIHELDSWLKLHFEYTRTKDSFEVLTNTLGFKQISHFIGVLNGITKNPPLGLQFDESLGIVSIFDGRM